MYCKNIKYAQDLEYWAQKECKLGFITCQYFFFFTCQYFCVDYMLKNILDILDYIFYATYKTFTFFFLIFFNVATRKF